MLARKPVATHLTTLIAHPSEAPTQSLKPALNVRRQADKLHLECYLPKAEEDLRLTSLLRVVITQHIAIESLMVAGAG